MIRPLSFVVALLVAGGGLLSASDLQVAADGRASVLRLGADSANRIEKSLPGGFVITVFTGADTKEVRLDRATVRGDRLVVTGSDGLPRLTFEPGNPTSESCRSTS
jgi:hypothetical protein